MFLIPFFVVYGNYVVCETLTMVVFINIDIIMCASSRVSLLTCIFTGGLVFRPGVVGLVFVASPFPLVPAASHLSAAVSTLASPTSSLSLSLSLSPH